MPEADPVTPTKEPKLAKLLRRPRYTDHEELEIMGRIAELIVRLPKERRVADLQWALDCAKHLERNQTEGDKQ